MLHSLDPGTSSRPGIRRRWGRPKPGEIRLPTAGIQVEALVSSLNPP